MQHTSDFKVGDIVEVVLKPPSLKETIETVWGAIWVPLMDNFVSSGHLLPVMSVDIGGKGVRLHTLGSKVKLLTDPEVMKTVPYDYWFPPSALRLVYAVDGRDNTAPAIHDSALEVVDITGPILDVDTSPLSKPELLDLISRLTFEYTKLSTFYIERSGLDGSGV